MIYVMDGEDEKAEEGGLRARRHGWGSFEQRVTSLNVQSGQSVEQKSIIRTNHQPRSNRAAVISTHAQRRGARCSTR